MSTGSFAIPAATLPTLPNAVLFCPPAMLCASAPLNIAWISSAVKLASETFLNSSNNFSSPPKD